MDPDRSALLDGRHVTAATRRTDDGLVGGAIVRADDVESFVQKVNEQVRFHGLVLQEDGSVCPEAAVVRIVEVKRVASLRASGEAHVVFVSSAEPH